MGKSVADAMTFEQTGSMAISKRAAKHADRAYDVRSMTTTSIVWYLVTRHKFALVCVAFATYVTFSLFGTLIVGVIQSL